MDPDTKEHWEQIQKTEGGTANLLRNFEDYANTLAQNVRKTYLKPFTIVTDNMSEWRRRGHTSCNVIPPDKRPSPFASVSSPSPPPTQF